MIEVARRKATKARADVDFRVALIEEIPFPDGHFDLVLSSLMLHHLPDDLKRRGLGEVYRVLKPGGRFLALDLGGHSHSLWGHLLVDGADPDRSRREGKCHGGGCRHDAGRRLRRRGSGQDQIQAASLRAGDCPEVCWRLRLEGRASDLG